MLFERVATGLAGLITSYSDPIQVLIMVGIGLYVLVIFGAQAGRYQ